MDPDYIVFGCLYRNRIILGDLCSQLTALLDNPELIVDRRLASTVHDFYDTLDRASVEMDELEDVIKERTSLRPTPL